MTDNRDIAIYIRLSAEDADIDGGDKLESNSISAQRRYLLDYVRDEFGVSEKEVMEYCDDGYSGTNFQRPGMQRLLEDVRNEKLSCVLVKDFSRLGRDYLEVGNLLEYIFPLMQVRFISLNDGYDSNERFGATGGMSVGLQNLVYAMYSRDLSKKVRSAVRTRQLNGEYMGRLPRYGYAKSSTERNKLVIDPAAAAVVKRIFELSAAGKSSYEICRIFNAEKVMTCAEYHKSIGHQFNLDSKNEKKLWQSSVVVGIIRDETYLGKMICNRVVKNMGTQNKTLLNDRSEWLVVDNAHEAIVSQDLFDRANATIRNVNYKPPEQRKRGPLFICGKCNRALLYRKGGKTYYCRSARYESDSGCRCIKGKTADIENTVLTSVLKTAELVAGSFKKKKSVTGNYSRLEKELADIDKELMQMAAKKMALYDDYKNGKHTREEFVAKSEAMRERMELCGERQAEIKDQIEEINRLSDTNEEMKMLDEMLGMTSFELERIKQVVDKVIVHASDELEIVYKANDFIREMVEGI